MVGITHVTFGGIPIRLLSPVERATCLHTRNLTPYPYRAIIPKTDKPVQELLSTSLTKTKKTNPNPACPGVAPDEAGSSPNNQYAIINAKGPPLAESIGPRPAALFSAFRHRRRSFDKILRKARAKKGTFHDIRRTAISMWLANGMREHDVMVLAGHSRFATTHKFYLAIADDLVHRARTATAQGLRRKLVQIGADDF